MITTSKNTPLQCPAVTFEISGPIHKTHITSGQFEAIWQPMNRQLSDPEGVAPGRLQAGHSGSFQVTRSAALTQVRAGLELFVIVYITSFNNVEA
jgi:hypothetical protein